MFMVPSLADYKPLQIPYFHQNVNPAKHKVTQASNCTIDHELHYSYPGSQFALLPEAKKLQYFYNVTSQRLHRLNAHFFFYIRMICTGKKKMASLGFWDKAQLELVTYLPRIFPSLVGFINFSFFSFFFLITCTFLASLPHNYLLHLFLPEYNSSLP